MTSQLATHSHLNPSRFPQSNHILLIIAAANGHAVPYRLGFPLLLPLLLLSSSKTVTHHFDLYS